MNVYEQQARALKEIAAELKGIRRALESIDKSLKPDVEIVVDNEEAEAFFCDWKGTECTMCVTGECLYRSKGGAGNG